MSFWHFFIIFLLLTPSLCHCLSSSSCRTSSEMQFSDCVSSAHQKCSRSGPKGNQTAPQPKSAGRTILRHSHVLICSKNKPGPKDSQQQQQRYWAWSNHQRCAATSKGKMLIVASVLLVSLVKQHPVINSTVLVSLGFRWLSSHAPTELNVFNLSLKVHQMNYISCCVYSNCSVQCWIQLRMFVLTLRPSKMKMSLFLYQNRFGEIEHYITCSLMDPLQWMGAVRITVQTADKNITIIHTTPVHQWSENLRL